MEVLVLNLFLMGLGFYKRVPLFLFASASLFAYEGSLNISSGDQFLAIIMFVLSIFVAYRGYQIFGGK